MGNLIQNLNFSQMSDDAFPAGSVCFKDNSLKIYTDDACTTEDATADPAAVGMTNHGCNAVTAEGLDGTYAFMDCSTPTFSLKIGFTTDPCDGEGEGIEVFSMTEENGVADCVKVTQADPDAEARYASFTAGANALAAAAAAALAVAATQL